MITKIIKKRIDSQAGSVENSALLALPKTFKLFGFPIF